MPRTASLRYPRGHGTPWHLSCRLCLSARSCRRHTFRGCNSAATGDGGETLLSVQLPPLAEGDEVHVTYPFVFGAVDDE